MEAREDRYPKNGAERARCCRNGLSVSSRMSSHQQGFRQINAVLLPLPTHRRVYVHIAGVMAALGNEGHNASRSVQY